MSRSSGRGQVEPLAALVAVAVLGLALALYAGALDAAMPAPERTVEEAALERSVAVLRTGAVVVPGRVRSAAAAAPDGYRVRVAVTAANRTWTAGPESPATADAAVRTLPVRVTHGVAVPGQVRVEVWQWPVE